MKGCGFLGTQIRISESKTGHEFLKSTLWVDSSDQIQIRIFESHNESERFLGKDLKKVFLTSGFPDKNV